MPRRIPALIASLALLVPALGLSALGSAVAPARSAHACCVRGAAAMHCGTLAFECCPPVNRRSESTPPVSATTGDTTLVPAHGSHVGTSAPDLVRVLAADAHARARLKAPPGPLYLKHLTLLV